jgi:NarL family two-component system response regulator LiaR
MEMGQTILSGRFKVGSLIGGGATGSVYAGEDTLTGEKVAIKALRRELVAGMPELVERFRREGEALRRLNHPNIVKVLATDEEAGQHFIVMEFVGGGSLADLLRRTPKLPIDRVVAIALELADALSRAHHLDILHRDIKPANILLAADGAPRLTDFGLAQVGSAQPLTTAGSILGTFAYLSPEACHNQKLDSRADLWSFGIVLYEMLTGRLPFEGDTPFEVMRAIDNQPLPDPTWTRDDIPPVLVDLVRKMLMKDRLARSTSARLVGAALEDIQRKMKDGGGMSKPLAPAVPLASPKKETASPSIPPHETPPPPSSKIRVLIVDDHAVVRQGLRTFIDLQDDMQVVGEGENGAQAVELAGRLHPDIVLLDLVMPQMDGVEATREIVKCSPKSRVLILTSFGEDDKVFPAIRGGAQGYLLKDIHPNDLVQAVREAHQGKVQLHPDIARKIMSAVAAAAPAQGALPSPGAAAPPSKTAATDLTEREREVLCLIARGMNNHEIAENMVISEKTVKTHVSNILGKLGVEDRTQAAIWALKHGFGA